jgi:putative transposase
MIIFATMNPYFVERKKGAPYSGLSIQYRMYPTKVQEKYLIQLGNKLRGAYNLLVRTYINDKPYGTFPKKNKETQKELYDLLINTEWLQDVPIIFLNYVENSFFVAIKNFKDAYDEEEKKKAKKKREIKPPKTKKQTYETLITTNHGNIKNFKIDWENQTLSFLENILKRNKVPSTFKMVYHKKFVGATLKNFSINRESDGKWYVSMSFDVTNIVKFPKQVISDNEVGIDVGIKDMAITSDGQKYQLPIDKIKCLEDKVSKLQKGISRKQRLNKGHFKSKNYFEQLRRIGRLNQKIKNLRQQTHNHATNVLTNGRYGKIQLEDMKLDFMLKNRYLSRAVSRIALYAFKARLKAVSNTKGIVFNVVSARNTSKTCSECGNIYDGLKLNHRTWTCECCGTFHDRDINAAKNIKKSLEIRN